LEIEIGKITRTSELKTAREIIEILKEELDIGKAVTTTQKNTFGSHIILNVKKESDVYKSI
jgi:hypothetical protein